MSTTVLSAEQMLFRGRVQGVGFRVTAQEIAHNYGLTGTVRNLPDGNVELIAQGIRKDLDEFVEAVTERFRKNIQGLDRQPCALDDSRTSFEILR